MVKIAGDVVELTFLCDKVSRSDDLRPPTERDRGGQRGTERDREGKREREKELAETCKSRSRSKSKSKSRSKSRSRSKPNFKVVNLACRKLSNRT